MSNDIWLPGGVSYVNKVRVRVSRIRELNRGVCESENRVR